MKEKEKERRKAIISAFKKRSKADSDTVDEIEKRFFKLAIDPCYTIYEIFNRLRGAFDLVESLYNCGAITYDLCVELEKRINNRFAKEMIKEDEETGVKK